MDKFRIEVIASTPNPQQVVWAAMHQDYCEDFIAERRDRFPDEDKAGELIIRHLLSANRGHFGPLEHPQITLNVGYFPHSMMQQIRTHRVGVSFDVQCLAGNTEITFVQTSGALKKIQIAELYDIWTNGEKAVRERKIQGRNGEPPGKYRRNCEGLSPELGSGACTPRQKRLQKMNLRVLNEETKFFETGHIKDIMCSGVNDVYRVTLADGKTIDCTTNHRLFTSLGWQKMGNATGLLTDVGGNAIAMTKQCFVMCNGLAVAGKGGTSTERELIGSWTKQVAPQVHKKFNYICHEEIHHNNQEIEFANTFKPILESTNWHSKPKSTGNKLKAHPVEIVKVEYLGKQITYDLEVEGKWHNFVANGMVVHNSFRYTGQRIIDVVEGKRDIEDVFYLRPVGDYSDRQGKRYFYSPEQRQEDLNWCLNACKLYQKRLNEGLAEEHARSLIPFDARQHFVLSCNARSLMHLLDLRWKKDAQLEAQKFCELLYLRFEEWIPAVALWYKENRAQKARLSP
jgi:thymidylate synthase (FAD)